MPARSSSEVGRKVNREIVVLIGWGRAILLQLAHPLLAAAISDNSGFHAGAGGYVRRARETIGAMLDVTFGTPEEAQLIVDRINAIHDRVNGHLRTSTGVFPAGTYYSARDPKLLIWVHCTLVESLVQTYECLIGPLNTSERDQFAKDAAWLTGELGAPMPDVPATYSAVQQFMRDIRDRGEIVVGDDARSMARALLAPPVGVLTPVFSVTRLVTVGLLPEELRHAYGFAWDERRAHRFERVVGLIRRTRRLLPRAVREWPAARRT